MPLNEFKWIFLWQSHVYHTICMFAQMRDHLLCCYTASVSIQLCVISWLDKTILWIIAWERFDCTVKPVSSDHLTSDHVGGKRNINCKDCQWKDHLKKKKNLGWSISDMLHWRKISHHQEEHMKHYNSYIDRYMVK